MVIDGTTRDPSHAYNPLIGSILPRAAGTGIAELISQAMAEAGMDIHEARRRNALFDKEEALDDCRAAFPAEHYSLDLRLRPTPPMPASKLEPAR